MRKANVNGVDLAYCIDSDESKPWLVLSNSLAADHRMWRPQMDTLQKTHRVLRYDTRGHGESEATEGPYRLDQLVDDLAALMGSLGINSADVLGLSLGGMTALGLAIRYPERVNGLLCCDARADAPQAYAEFWVDRIAVAKEQGLPALVDGTLGRWFTESFRDDPANQSVIDLARSMILSTSLEGFCGCAAALTTLNYKPDLSTINVPTLCVVGDQDAAAPPSVMADMAALIPQGRLQVIDDAAHVSNLNQPGAFNRIVSEWYVNKPAKRTQ